MNAFGIKTNILFLVCLACLACRQDKIETNTGEMVSYQDSVFLEIKGDLHEHEVIWGGKDIWMKALMRMERHLWIKDNRFVWNIENGAQVKVSQNIYEHLTGIWEDFNEKLSTGKYKLKDIDGRSFPVLITTEDD